MARSNNNLTAVMQDTANAIREKTGSSEDICPRDFGDQILAIPTGIEPTGTIDITTNGTHNVAQYGEANVNVPQPTGILKYYFTGNKQGRNAESVNVQDYSSMNIYNLCGHLYFPKLEDHFDVVIHAYNNHKNSSGVASDIFMQTLATPTKIIGTTDQYAAKMYMNYYTSVYLVEVNMNNSSEPSDWYISPRAPLVTNVPNRTNSFVLIDGILHDNHMYANGYYLDINDTLSIPVHVYGCPYDFYDEDAIKEAIDNYIDNIFTTNDNTKKVLVVDPVGRLVSSGKYIRLNDLTLHIEREPEPGPGSGSGSGSGAGY